tara:strand:- start:51 stop:290 length:240 start_codon:yes stop_codon:yes gene_type:complete
MNSILVILTTISLLIILVTETSVKEYNSHQHKNIEITDYEDYGCLNDPHEPESDGDGVNIEYLNSVFNAVHQGDLNEVH